MKHFFQEFKKKWLVWGILIFLITLFGYLGVVEFRGWYALKGELKEQEKEIKNVLERKEDISRDIVEATNPNSLEKEARLKLNLKKEGEEVFVVVGLENILKEENFEEEKNTKDENQDKFLANIINWWNYFFKP